MRCEAPFCGRETHRVWRTPVFHPITMSFDEVAEQFSGAPRKVPDATTIDTCHDERCKLWARLKSEDARSPWIEDYARMMRRENPHVPQHMVEERRERDILEATARIAAMIERAGGDS